MDELTVFAHEQFGEIRMVVFQNEPWFVAVDVCGALEIGNPSQAISRLDEDERRTTLISNEGAASGKSSMAFINEPGLYSLVLGSRKPEAKAFKRWITHEVVPAIRRHGLYATEELIANPDLAIAAFQALKDEREKNRVQREQIEKLAPKAAYYDAVTQAEGTTGIRDTAKLLGMKQNEFTEFLLDYGYCYRNGRNCLMPRANKQWVGMFEVCEYMQRTATGTHTRIYMVITPRGRAALMARLQREGLLQKG